MATVINVTMRGQQVLVNLEMVASITFKRTSSDSSATAQIVTAAAGNRGDDSSGPHVVNVVGDEDVAALQAELVRVGWMAADPMPQGMPSFEAASGV